MFIMSLTEFTVLFEHLELCDLRIIGKLMFVIYAIYSKSLFRFVVYMLLVTMLLINM